MQMAMGGVWSECTTTIAMDPQEFQGQKQPLPLPCWPAPAPPQPGGAVAP